MARLDDPPTAQGSADVPRPKPAAAESPDLGPPTPGHPPLGAVSPPSTSTPPPDTLTTSPDALSDLSSPPTSATSPNPLASPPKPAQLPPLALPTSSSSPSFPSPGPASPSSASRPSRPTSRPPSSRPPSRPPSVSRPPSLSRPPSVTRRRSSASSVPRVSTSGGDSRRLSAGSAGGSAGSNVPPASPRIPEDSVLLASSTSSSSSTAAATAAAADPAPTPADIVADSPGGPTADDNEVPILVIRDYAFARDDPRFEGRQLPEEVEAERERERRFRAEREEGERLGAAGLGGAAGAGGPSGSGFHWGFVTSHSSDFPQSSDLSDTSSSSGSPPGGYAFDDSELASSSSGAQLVGDGEAGLDGEGEGGWPSDGIDGELELGEFVPGVYAALYEFEPELETEMRLEAGEMVSVFERQCAGWVQAGRIVDSRLTGEVGLVPENYLELVEPNPQVEAEGELDEELGEGEGGGLEVRNGVEGEKGSLVDEKGAPAQGVTAPPDPQTEVAAAAGS
ncbi:hypothetical protein JCM9279_007052 [Rhodotorula babjevae]